MSAAFSKMSTKAIIGRVRTTEELGKHSQKWDFSKLLDNICKSVIKLSNKRPQAWPTI
jgi:hypothetical protein